MTNYSNCAPVFVLVIITLVQGCPEGFFTTDGVNQCFKVFLDSERTWREAKLKCEAEGLRMAQILDSVARTIFEPYRDLYGWGNLWLDARGGYDSEMRWQRDQTLIPKDSPLWLWGYSVNAHGNESWFETDHCLTLNYFQRDFKYMASNCSGKTHTLCEGLCPRKQFQCPNGRCISYTWLCDGKDDCSDGADENKCHESCSRDEFQCPNGACINMRWLLDGDNDCKDGTDEKTYLGCPDDFFISNVTRQCLKMMNDKLKTWLDAKRRCESMGLLLAKTSDVEAVRMCRELLEIYGYGQNEDSRFVGGAWVDAKGVGTAGTGMVWQRDMMEVKRTEVNGNYSSNDCMYIWVHSMQFHYSHGEAYGTADCLAAQYFALCEDINECRINNGGCEQICTNNIGSNSCKCYDGYVLSDNKKSCNIPSGVISSGPSTVGTVPGDQLKIPESDSDFLSILIGKNTSTSNGQISSSTSSSGVVPTGSGSLFETCGHSLHNPFNAIINERISNGRPTIPGQYPWMVHLKYFDKFLKEFKSCGATIISKRWALSAAHCFSDLDNDTDLIMKIGYTDLSNFEKGAKLFGVKKSSIRIPDAFNRDTLENDIALIRLPEDLIFNNVTQRICIGQEWHIPYGGKAFAVGWGLIKPSGNIPNLLQEVELDVLSKSDAKCSNTENFICTFTPGKDTCSGDSGGPLMIQKGNKWYQVGIVSHGPLDCGNHDSPGVYTKIAKHLPFISRHARS